MRKDTEMKFYLKAGWEKDYREVTKEEFIRAERAAGFRPKLASSDPEYMNTLATGGFSNMEIFGKIEYENWNEWRGGEPPVAAHEPVRIWWPNGIRRTYERGDYIVWHNLRTDGAVKWRKV